MLHPATLGDVTRAASWVTSAAECEFWAGPRVPYPIDLRTLPALIDFAHVQTYSILEAGELLAFGQLVSKGRRRGHLARLIVSPAHRGRGLGETLVRGLIEEARAANHRVVSLNVDPRNAPAIALYRKVGFEEAERPRDEPDSSGSRYLTMML